MKSDAPFQGDKESTEKCFAFVIPVRNPRDKKVNDYRTIEAVLEMTVASLLRQTHRNIAIVVVCHGAPDWADGLDERVRFLDVSNDDVFAPDQNPKEIDKGLRLTIGILYASFAFRPDLIMLMDADDYVHVGLADQLVALHADAEDTDCYLVKRGVHAGVHVGADYRVRFRFAVEVDEFDFTCGSCRIFDASTLRSRLSEIDPAIEKRFGDWPSPGDRGCVDVESDRLLWLRGKVGSIKGNRDHIIYLLGRHVRQKRGFRVRDLNVLGAAKGCGHGNHNGPRQGAVHWHRATRNIPIPQFLATFGLPKQPWSFEAWARFRARSADKKAGRTWVDNYAKTK